MRTVNSAEPIGIHTTKEEAGTGQAQRTQRLLAGHHSRRRNQAFRCDSTAPSGCLIIGKKERFVLLQSAAKRTSELIEVELVLRHSKKVLRVELGIPEELEQRSVELVRSRLRRYQHRRTCASTVLSAVVIDQYFEFLDGVDRRQNRDATRGQFVVVDAIEQPICFLSPRTAH